MWGTSDNLPAIGPEELKPANHYLSIFGLDLKQAN